jgi:hypothetical protein
VKPLAHPRGSPTATTITNWCIGNAWQRGVDFTIGIKIECAKAGAGAKL